MIIPAEAEEKSSPDHLGGFFASVVLALLACTWGASGVLWVLGQVGLPAPATLGHDISAALFVALLIADPIGTFLNKTPPKRMLYRAVCGFLFGWVFQHFFVTPIAGGGVSMFVFLALSLVLLPLMVAVNAIERALERRGIEVSEQVGRGVIRVLRLPRAVPVAASVVVAFQLLWWFTPGPVATLWIMAGAMVLILLPPLTIPILSAEEEETAKPAGPAFSRYSALALYELVMFLKWHFGTVVYFTSAGWLANGILPFSSEWQRLLSAATALLPQPLLVKAALSLSVLFAALFVAMLTGRIFMTLLGKLLRWPAENARLRYGLFRNTLLLRT